ncbi:MULTISPECIES: sensor histidine kinase [Halomonadaceae]|uniref:sensor histidine kinase n=1 Tax=Halomonadaceae TaxID=28256 RepID=UPI001D17916F|nr:MULTISPECIES: sensor histidine kinase [Halomonas]MCC4289620.1 hypothetical protein [Halomonas axialensis]MCF2913751.1 ATP-binding protein [Halomonas sp. Cn5-12]|tara:strand:- start:1765 stop:2652 length:888 start_codon:yes stop_codon:yes gene_type:complete
MTKEEAIKLLDTGSSHERLKAARFLADNPEIENIIALRKARRKETVSYVKKGINLAIDKLDNMPAEQAVNEGDETSVSQEVKKQIKSQAIEWIAGLLLHEIASPIGLVKRSAAREIDNYKESSTKAHLDNVSNIFEAIEQLKSASATPKIQNFDFFEVLNGVVEEEVEKKGGGAPSLVGPRPMMILSDPTLVRLAVSNGIRNAIEAVNSLGDERAHPVTINWGETDVDYWVSVIDEGPGLSGPMQAAFEIGRTNKKNHSGFGLAIARQAMESLNGEVSLEPGANGGARYEARWEK